MAALRSTEIEHRVIVGMADLAVSNNPSVTLATYSLGSCVAVAIFDPVARAGGLLHIMLPDSSIDTAKAEEHPGMFVDTGLAALLHAMRQLGCEKDRWRLAVAGGSQIMDSSGYFNIGRRNLESVDQLIQKLGLRVAAQQVGGLVNRTLFLHLGTGEVRLKISGQSSDQILLCGNSMST